MITNLTIKNYKCHQNTNLMMKPLTILTGINGFGKSSAIQSLLLLRQTHLKNRLNAGLDLNMPLVSVGIGNDALYKFASKPLITFILSYKDSKECVFSFDAEKALTSSFIPLEKDDKLNADIISSESLFNNGFQYISAFREGGVSTFRKDNYAVEVLHQISSELGKGDLVGHFLFKNQAMPTYNYLDGSDDLPLIDQVQSWEQKISPNITINVEENSDKTGYVVKYGYVSDGKNTLNNLRAENIGFGVSYTLPVIVALISARQGDLIIIENPEAHLHPEGQIELGNLICKVAQRGVQVIVETHSDHIINATQVACKIFNESNGKDGIKKDNVAIHFFGIKTDKYAASSQDVVLKSDGSIDYQPTGFFDTLEKTLYKLY